MTKKPSKSYKRKKLDPIRSDTFVKMKTVFGKVDNGHYIQFRSKMFLLEITPTEFFSECLMLFLKGDKRVMSIIDQILESKNLCKLKQIEYVTPDVSEMSENDIELLYSSLENEDKND